jgi:hypothetical protein
MRSFEEDENSFPTFPLMAQLVPIIFINNNVNTHHLHALSPPGRECLSMIDFGKLLEYS